MKKSFKILAILALGASAFFLNGCSEVEDPTPDPTPVCYMQSSSEDGYVTTYTYDADNRVVSSTYEGETTTYAYTDGKLTTATNGTVVSTFTYGADPLPTRVDVKDNGADDGYYILESTDAGLTKIEVHDAAGDITDVTYATYDASGNVTSIQIDAWDEDSMDYVTYASITNIMTDNKVNPFLTSFALVYANIESAVIYGKSNLVSGNFTLFGQSFPVTATHTYNDNNVPLTTDFSALGETTKYVYTYECK